MKTVILILFLALSAPCLGQKKEVPDFIQPPEIEVPLRFKIAKPLVYGGIIITGIGILVGASEDSRRLRSINLQSKSPEYGRPIRTVGVVCVVVGAALVVDYTPKKTPITLSMGPGEIKFIYRL